MGRKTFSAKQKKAQLQAKRAKKRGDVSGKLVLQFCNVLTCAQLRIQAFLTVPQTAVVKQRSKLLYLKARRLGLRLTMSPAWLMTTSSPCMRNPLSVAAVAPLHAARIKTGMLSLPIPWRRLMSDMRSARAGFR